MYYLFKLKGIGKIKTLKVNLILELVRVPWTRFKIG